MKRSREQVDIVGCKVDVLVDSIEGFDRFKNALVPGTVKKKLGESFLVALDCLKEPPVVVSSNCLFRPREGR